MTGARSAMPWGSYFGSIVVLGVVCAIAWAIDGAVAALGAAAALLLATVVHHLRHVALLKRWLRDPVPEAVPAGSGVWDRIFGELYRMLRHQRQSESQLAATLEDFRQAGAAMPDGLVILNASDRIEWCNPLAERHFGLDRARDVGQSITFLVRQPQFVEYLAQQKYSEPLTLRQSRGRDYI